MNEIDIEKEDDTEKEEFSEISTPYDVSKIDILYEPEYVDRLVKKYDNKELNLNPDFQRNEVWKIKQKSRLIESILIKIPIPSFYIDARDEANWIVIDGLQRLSTIIRYIKDEFALKDLEFLKELENKKFSQLDRNFQRRIEDFKLTLYLIRPNTPEEIAFNIFIRINTLAEPLSPQEIRHAIYNGTSTKLLQELSISKEFVESVKPTEAMQMRMNDRELILRLLAFKTLNYLNYPKSNNLAIFLANTMKNINSMKEPEIEVIRVFFQESMKRAKLIFENYAFRKIYLTDNEKTKIRPINKSLFETFGYFLPLYEIDKLQKAKNIIIQNLKNELSTNLDFEKSISSSTNSIYNVHCRFERVKEIIENSIKELQL